MRRHSRFRRIAKWTGLVLCVLVLVAWGVSVKWVIRLTWDDGTRTHAYGLAAGLAIWSQVFTGLNLPLRLEAEPLAPGAFTGTDRFGLCLPVRLWLAGRRWGYTTIPLWIPFVLLAVPTALLWWRDRKPPLGHCQHCGYNLTGNRLGVCPGCGESIDTRAALPSAQGD